MNLNHIDDEIFAAVVAGVSKYMEYELSIKNKKQGRNSWKRPFMLENNIRRASLWRSIS